PARRAAKNFGEAIGRFHDSGEDLKGRGLACTVGTDQTEDLAVGHVEIDPAHCFDGAITLSESLHTNRSAAGNAVGPKIRFADIEVSDGHFFRRPSGHVSP